MFWFHRAGLNTTALSHNINTFSTLIVEPNGAIFRERVVRITITGDHS